MSQPLRVLLVEDSPDDAVLVESVLKKGGFAVSAMRVQRPEDLEKALKGKSWDVVVADMHFDPPTFRKFEPLQMVLEQRPDLPVIIISGYFGEDFVVEAMRAGAHDFVLKDKLVRLAPAVQRALREAEGKRARHAAEEKLRREYNLRAAIERTVPSGIIITDSTGMITYVNPAFCKLVGWSEANLVGSKPPYLFWPPEEAAVYQDQFWRGMSGGLELAERRFLRSNGEVIFVLRLASVLEEQGEGKRMLFAFTEITELKRKDEALRKLNEELEERVVERTADLNKALVDLRQAIGERRRLENELLEIVEKERQQLGLELHDDLGQRLSGLLMMTKGLEVKLKQKRRPESSQAGTIHTILDETVYRARNWTKHLVPPRAKELDLSSALKALAEHTQKIYGVKCRFKAKGKIPMLKAEVEEHLTKIAQEAVGNGIKHGKAQVLTITLTRSGDALGLQVANDGVAFPAVNPAKAGSGLRIMHYRAHLIGAHLEIRSRSQGGTEVRCLQPIKTD
jgi:PAS domain S-box-containing protein